MWFPIGDWPRCLDAGAFCYLEETYVARYLGVLRLGPLDSAGQARWPKQEMKYSAPRVPDHFGRGMQKERTHEHQATTRNRHNLLAVRFSRR